MRTGLSQLARRPDPADGVKVAFPTADFWHLRDGKVEVFDCHIAFTTLFAQLGVLPDYASAVGNRSTSTSDSPTPWPRCWPGPDSRCGPG